MNDDPRVYQKTAAGRAALADRTLSGKARTTLILINGRDSVRDLQAKLGADVLRSLDELQQLGFIEAEPAQQQPPPQSPAPPPPAAAPVNEAERLAAFKRELLVRLTPHFGPEVTVFAAPLMAATTATAFNAALGKIEARLALYLGKANAAKVLLGLRP